MDGQRQGADPEASLRAELLVQLLNAQSQLTAELADIRRTAPFSEAATAIEGQFAELANVQQRLASGTVSVAALRSEIAACVSASAGAIAQARAAAATERAEGIGMEAARAHARAAVSDFADAYYRDRIFDPYLQFASAEDEAAYRRREEERRLAIEAARAEGTPEGDLRAAQLALAQMDDAKAHGADASPEFGPIYDRLTDGERALRAEASPARNADAEAALAPSEPTQANEDVLAALRGAGVVLADQTAEGHGVNAVAPGSSQVVRS